MRRFASFGALIVAVAASIATKPPPPLASGELGPVEVHVPAGQPAELALTVEVPQDAVRLGIEGFVVAVRATATGIDPARVAVAVAGDDPSTQDGSSGFETTDTTVVVGAPFSQCVEGEACVFVYRVSITSESDVDETVAVSVRASADLPEDLDEPILLTLTETP